MLLTLRERAYTSLFEILQGFSVKLQKILIDQYKNSSQIGAFVEKLQVLEHKWHVLPDLLICIQEFVESLEKS